MRREGVFVKPGALAAMLVVLAVVVTLVLLAVALIPPRGGGGQCRGSARCYSAAVESIVDGDTLDIGGERIRLALVDTPERGEPGYAEAKDFTAATCPVGSTALVDEDDGQTSGSYGRMIAKVTCGGRNLNASLLDSGLADLAASFCDESEFADEAWTGC